MQTSSRTPHTEPRNRAERRHGRISAPRPRLDTTPETHEGRRAAYAAHLVEVAIWDGRLPESARARWVARLESGGAAAHAELRALTSVSDLLEDTPTGR